MVGGGGGGAGWGGEVCQRIKPHYRSEGPRQGSCGVFGGSTTLSALFTRVYSSNDVLCH